MSFITPKVLNIPLPFIEHKITLPSLKEIININERYMYPIFPFHVGNIRNFIDNLIDFESDIVVKELLLKLYNYNDNIVKKLKNITLRENIDIKELIELRKSIFNFNKDLDFVKIDESMLSTITFILEVFSYIIKNMVSFTKKEINYQELILNIKKPVITNVNLNKITRDVANSITKVKLYKYDKYMYNFTLIEKIYYFYSLKYNCDEYYDNLFKTKYDKEMIYHFTDEQEKSKTLIKIFIDLMEQKNIDSYSLNKDILEYEKLIEEVKLNYIKNESKNFILTFKDKLLLKYQYNEFGGYLENNNFKIKREGKSSSYYNDNIDIYNLYKNYKDKIKDDLEDCIKDYEEKLFTIKLKSKTNISNIIEDIINIISSKDINDFKSYKELADFYSFILSSKRKAINIIENKNYETINNLQEETKEKLDIMLHKKNYLFSKEEVINNSYLDGLNKSNSQYSFYKYNFELPTKVFEFDIIDIIDIEKYIDRKIDLRSIHNILSMIKNRNTKSIEILFLKMYNNFLLYFEKYINFLYNQKNLLYSYYKEDEKDNILLLSKERKKRNKEIFYKYLDLLSVYNQIKIKNNIYEYNILKVYKYCFNFLNMNYDITDKEKYLYYIFNKSKEKTIEKYISNDIKGSYSFYFFNEELPGSKEEIDHINILSIDNTFYDYISKIKDIEYYFPYDKKFELLKNLFIYKNEYNIYKMNMLNIKKELSEIHENFDKKNTELEFISFKNQCIEISKRRKNINKQFSIIKRKKKLNDINIFLNIFNITFDKVIYVKEVERQLNELLDKL